MSESRSSTLLRRRPESPKCMVFDENAADLSTEIRLLTYNDIVGWVQAVGILTKMAYTVPLAFKLLLYCILVIAPKQCTDTGDQCAAHVVRMKPITFFAPASWNVIADRIVVGYWTSGLRNSETGNAPEVSLDIFGCNGGIIGSGFITLSFMYTRCCYTVILQCRLMALPVDNADRQRGGFGVTEFNNRPPLNGSFGKTGQTSTEDDGRRGAGGLSWGWVSKPFDENK